MKVGYRSIFQSMPGWGAQKSKQRFLEASRATLVFCLGRAKSFWVNHELRIAWLRQAQKWKENQALKDEEIVRRSKYEDFGLETSA